MSENSIYRWPIYWGCRRPGRRTRWLISSRTGSRSRRPTSTGSASNCTTASTTWSANRAYCRTSSATCANNLSLRWSRVWFCTFSKTSTGRTCVGWRTSGIRVSAEANSNRWQTLYGSWPRSISTREILHVRNMGMWLLIYLIFCLIGMKLSEWWWYSNHK